MDHLLFLATLIISFPLLAFSQCDPQDQAALLQIKSHFGGVGRLREWVPTTHCCDWPFIVCNNDDYDVNPFRVNTVNISGGGTGLRGTIPDSLGNLPFLRVIIFTEEPKLTRPIPQSLSKLTMPYLITLHSNSLSGPIPTFFGNLMFLTQLDISGNKFTGTLPTFHLTSPQLTLFNVSHNMVTGSIPNFPKTLTNMATLMLVLTSFVGKFQVGCPSLIQACFSIINVLVVLPYHHANDDVVIAATR